jgi:5'-nucleotidase
VSCTTPDWVRVAGESPPAAAAAAAATDAAFGDGIVELTIPLHGALDHVDDWCKGKRWFQNKPGPAREDRREGYDKRALDDGYVSVSVLGVETTTMCLSGEGATGGDMGQLMAAFGDAHCRPGPA